MMDWLSEEARAEALREYDESVESYRKYVAERPELAKLADSVLKLRQLEELPAAEALRVLRAKAGASFLQLFGEIVSGGQLRLPRDLESLLFGAWFAITQQKSLWLAAVELQDDLAEMWDRKHSQEKGLVTNPPPVWRCFFAVAASAEQLERETKEWAQRPRSGMTNPKALQIVWRKVQSVQAFAKMLDELAAEPAKFAAKQFQLS